MLARVVVDFAHFAPGQIFARRYQFVRLVKAGGMGAVYEANHIATRRRVALKVMRPEIVSDTAERARFVQEAQVATIIESAHVVDVLDAGVDEETGVPFLVMEYLVGEELGDHIKRVKRLSPQDAVRWLSQAARALDKAHARGVIHRDLKPENLFLSTRDEGTTLKILDFGIAKVLQAAAASSTRGAGTPLYMAPEQTRRSSKIGPATDVWALGLIAYKLVVGANYWVAEDVHSLLGEILVEPLESPTAKAAARGVALPPTFDGWFFACVNRDPSSRYRSAGEAVMAFASVFGVEHQVSLPGTPAYVPSSPPAVAATLPQTQPSGTLVLAQTTGTPSTDDPRRPPGVKPIGGRIAIGLGVLAIGGAIVFALTRTSDPPTSPSTTTSTTSAGSASGKPSSSATPGDDLAKQIAKSDPFVKLGGLSVQRHEITREEFAAFVTSLPEHQRPKARPRADWNGEPVDDATAKHPVAWITFERASDFCDAIGARLPTSADWTKAMEGADLLGAQWPKGKKDLAVALGDKSAPRDVELAADDVTPSGVHDLAGNLQEWTTTTAQTDGMKIVRGASFSMDPTLVRDAIATGLPKFTEKAAGKDAAVDAIAGAGLGFRCVK
jgi:serine/threonine-protein kinase